MGSITTGGSASASVVVKPSSRELFSVNLLAGSTPEGGGLPSGLNVSFGAPVGIPPFTSVMKISTSPELPPGVYPFLVIATSEDTKQMMTYTLIVRSGKPAAEKLAAQPTQKQTAKESVEEGSQ
jgi:hypothetical protein